MAFVGSSALATGATISVTPTYGSATAGNLLVALVTGQMATPANTTLSGTGAATAGWTLRASASATNIECEIWDKIAVGNDVMPTWNGVTGNNEMVCQIVEFSGTTTLDQVGTKGGAATTSPQTVTAAGVDGGVSRMIIAVRKVRGSSAATTTWTDNVNGLGVGVGINALGDDGATSQTGHHRGLYVTTAVTGSSADNDVATWSQTTTHAALCIASYYQLTVINASDSTATADAASTIGVSGPNESATGTDAASQINLSGPSDSTANVDAASTVTVTHSDSTQTVDNPSLIAVSGVNESTVDTDAATIAATVTSSDTTSTADGVISIGLSASDNTTIADAVSLISLTGIGDSTIDLDATGLISISASDATSVSDAVTRLMLAVAEATITTDLVGLVSLSAAEVTHGADAYSLITPIFAIPGTIDIVLSTPFTIDVETTRPNEIDLTIALPYSVDVEAELAD